MFELAHVAWKRVRIEGTNRVRRERDARQVVALAVQLEKMPGEPAPLFGTPLA